MADESGKGIALVILGIVAIIAIVGLVLLFTGYKKGAAGAFAPPAAKEYGGAIRGAVFPIARATPGRAVYPSGNVGEYGGLSGGEMQKVAWDVTGEGGTPKTVSTEISYNRPPQQVPSVQTTCQGLVLANLDPSDDMFTEPIEARRYDSTYSFRPNACKRVSDLFAVYYQALGYPLDSTWTKYNAIGKPFCCTR